MELDVTRKKRKLGSTANGACIGTSLVPFLVVGDLKDSGRSIGIMPQGEGAVMSMRLS